MFHKLTQTAYKIKVNHWYYVLLTLYIFYGLFLQIISFPSFFGYSVLTNVSNSMSPLINTQSLTVVKAQKSGYTKGDIVAYYSQEKGKQIIVTHRIVSLGGNVYVTKGDANIATDKTLVTPRLVLGKVIRIYNDVGGWVRFLKSPLGIALFLGLPAFFFIVVEGLYISYNLKEKE